MALVSFLCLFQPEHKPIERMSSNESDNEDGEKRKGSKKKRSL